MTEATTPKPKYNVRNTIVSIYLTIMFTVFPLFLRETSYAYARTDKYLLFIIYSV